MGVRVFLSPIWTDPTGRATTTMVVLGITALVAAHEMFRPDLMATEQALVVLGVLVFVAPWVVGVRSEVRPMAWTTWVVGVVTSVIGAPDLQPTRVHRHAVATH